MSPERQQFQACEAWLSLRQPLKDRTEEAFYEDHPEVRSLYVRDDKRLEVNFYGENAAYKYCSDELDNAPISEDQRSKLKKCLEIMEDLFRRMG